MVPGTDIRREQRRKQRRWQQLLRRAMFAAAGGLVAAAVLLVVWNALPAGADTQPTSAEAAAVCAVFCAAPAGCPYLVP